jgi:hypothetical protein
MRQHFLIALPFAASLVWLACSSDPATTSSSGGGTSSSGSSGTTVSGDETWDSSKEIKGKVTVAAGATVTIKAGATLKCSAGAEVFVKGTLKVSASSNRAKISCATWKGLAVANGGTLDVDGLDVENPDTGVRMESGNTKTEATFKNGSITGTATPFLIGENAKLSVIKSKVQATGPSNIYGDIYMSYVDYDKGAAEGIIMESTNGSIVIEDSTLRGNGFTGEFVQSTKGKFVKVVYTTISDAHCALHFDSVESFEVDHITATNQVFGAMLYGSTKGGTLSNSNFSGKEQDIDVQGSNGTLTFDGIYAPRRDIRDTQPTEKNKANAEVPNAKPR